jgi:hypothetical protein
MKVLLLANAGVDLDCLVARLRVEIDASAVFFDNELCPLARLGGEFFHLLARVLVPLLPVAGVSADIQEFQSNVVLVAFLDQIPVVLQR